MEELIVAIKDNDVFSVAELIENLQGRVADSDNLALQTALKYTRDGIVSMLLEVPEVVDNITEELLLNIRRPAVVNMIVQSLVHSNRSNINDIITTNVLYDFIIHYNTTALLRSLKNPKVQENLEPDMIVFDINNKLLIMKLLKFPKIYENITADVLTSITKRTNKKIIKKLLSVPRIIETMDAHTLVSALRISSEIDDDFLVEELLKIPKIREDTGETLVYAARHYNGKIVKLLLEVPSVINNRNLLFRAQAVSSTAEIVNMIRRKLGLIALPLRDGIFRNDPFYVPTQRSTMTPSGFLSELTLQYRDPGAYIVRDGYQGFPVVVQEDNLKDAIVEESENIEHVKKAFLIHEREKEYILQQDINNLRKRLVNEKDTKEKDILKRVLRGYEEELSYTKESYIDRYNQGIKLESEIYNFIEKMTSPEEAPTLFRDLINLYDTEELYRLLENKVPFSVLFELAKVPDPLKKIVLKNTNTFGGLFKKKSKRTKGPRRSLKTSKRSKRTSKKKFPEKS